MDTMSVNGIDRNKCTKCKACIPECVALRFGWDDKSKEVMFHKDFGCILCGHCISVCPVDAIIYERIHGEPFEFEGIQNISSFLPSENLIKLIRSKRSIRQYKNEIVPKERLQQILEAMRYAPTGVNIRTLKCTILTGEKVEQLSREILNALLESNDVSDGNKWGFKAKLNQGRDPIFHNAPHVMIMHSPELEYVNATIAITHGMFVAETLGLGTCWIGWAQGTLNAVPQIREDILGFTDHVSGVFTIGFPDVKFKRCPTRPEIKTTWIQ